MAAKASATAEAVAAPSQGTPPLVLAAFAGTLVVWGAGYVVNRVAATNADPLWAGVLRTLLCGVVLLPLLLIFRVPLPRGRRDLSLLVVAALAGAVLWPVLLSLAAHYTTATRTGLIASAAPISVAVLATLFLGERFTRGKALGMVIALAGVAWLVAVRDEGGLGVGINLGDLIMVVAVCGVSVNYVGNGVLARTYPAWAITAWGMVIGAAVLVIPFLIWGIGPTREIGAAAWPSILYLAFVSNLVGGSLWYWGLSRGAIGRLGAFEFFQPVVVFLLAFIFLGETISLPMVLAAALIFAGVSVIQRS